MQFNYNHEKIKTTDELKISVADLRDLIQAAGLSGNAQTLEYQAIIAAIERKNRMQKGSIFLEPREIIG